MTLAGVRLRRFLKHIRNHHRIGIQAINDPPRLARIHDSQFVAPGPDGRHWPGVRHTEPLAALKASQQRPGFKAGRRRERRRLHLAAQPHQGLSVVAMSFEIYVVLDICQLGHIPRILLPVI
jgi:hypothetical protein